LTSPCSTTKETVMKTPIWYGDAAAVKPQRTSLRLTALLALVIAGLLAITGVAHSAARVAQPKPTIVLVHGAWADSSSWSGVVDRLQHDGYTVDVPPNPLRGLNQDSAFIADYLKTIPGPIVLVGHSYGGAVITNAATGNGEVKSLVYIDAFAPAKGETIGSLLKLHGPTSAVLGNPAHLFNLVPYPGAPKGDVDVYIKQSVFPSTFANDLPHAQAMELAATQRPLTYSTLGTRSGVPAWKTIPSWYLVGTVDRVIPPALQTFMAKRAHSHIVRVKASHLAMISQPGAVTSIILSAAGSAAQ
jgi:pimeloyl-ACP methyl ester carboxylesterase